MPTPRTAQLKAHNPLQRRPFTPAEYAQLHHTVQAKATMALKNLHSRLEVELTEARAAAQKELRELDAEVTELERLILNSRTRKQVLVKSLSAKTEDLRTLTELKHDLLTQGDRLDAARVESAELERLLTEEQVSLDHARRKLRRVRSRTAAVVAETAEAMAPMDEGTRRLLDAENEVIVLSSRRRNHPEPGNAAVSA